MLGELLNTKTINIDKTDNYRIIAISDIHGHLEIFKNLLKKINLKKEDYLVIIGDFINKGPDSYKTLKYLRELNKRGNTFILKGNHESFIYDYINDENLNGKMLDFLKKEYYETLIHDLVKLSHRNIKDFESGAELKEYINRNYLEEMNYINDLPIILKFDEFIFVHGGYEENMCVVKDENKFLKYDNYNELSGINNKTVIVGHWPTCNMRTHKHTNLPYINKEKNIISIDGGLGVKQSGELNGFIIEKKSGIVNYNLLQENNFVKKEIISEYIFKLEEQIFINYPFFDFDVIKKGELLTLCKHHNSNKYFSVFNSLLIKKENKYELKTTFINNFLNLKIGEEVLVCSEFEDCALVKYKKEFGWIRINQINKR